jgi:O-antigen ligase
MQSEESDFGWSKKRRDSLREIGAAHSLLLETAYEFGVVGVALLVALGAALIACARGAEVNARLMAVIALITITAVAGIGELVLNSRAIAASLAVSFALVAAVPGKRGRQGDEQPLPPEEFLPR